jgi:P27 family predicted phage terminase small subunit
MGKRGPSQTPSKVLQMRGTFRRDRHGDPESEPHFDTLKALPPAPGFFDDVALYEWQRVGAELIAKELLTEVDLAAFTMYCLNVARVVAAEKAINADGLTVLSPQGFKAHPAVAIARQCGIEVRKFSQEFGLTPSARTRVRTPEKPAAPIDDGWGKVAR